MSGAATIELPPWARVTEKRLGHIARVTALLDHWASAMGIAAEERHAWRDAGQWHDALRDAPEAELRRLVPDDAGYPTEILHGPAAARRLELDGEQRRDVLDAVRWHTVGFDGWSRTGRALYMADFLEPGRKFSRADRAFLAALVPQDFDGVLRQVVRIRLEWSLREGHPIFEETVRLWNAIR